MGTPKPKHASTRVTQRPQRRWQLAGLVAATLVGLTVGAGSTASANQPHDTPSQVGEVCEPAVPAVSEYRSREWVPATTHEEFRYEKVIPGTPGKPAVTHREWEVGKVFAEDVRNRHGYKLHSEGDPHPWLYGPYTLTADPSVVRFDVGSGERLIGELFDYNEPNYNGSGKKNGVVDYKYKLVAGPIEVIDQPAIPGTEEQTLYHPTDGSYTTDPKPEGYDVRDTKQVSNNDGHWGQWSEWGSTLIEPSEAREVESRTKAGTGTDEVVYQDENPEAPCYIEPEPTLVSPEPIVCTDGKVVLPETPGLAYSQEGSKITVEPLEGFTIDSDKLNGYVLDSEGRASLTLAEDECATPEPSVPPVPSTEPTPPSNPSEGPTKVPVHEQLASTGVDGIWAIPSAVLLVLAGGFAIWYRHRKVATS